MSFFIREEILVKQLTIAHVSALDQWADILTKPLSASEFEVIWAKLNVKTQCEECFSWKLSPLSLKGGGVLEYVVNQLWKQFCKLIVRDVRFC